jgi:hypothetical protein
MTIQQLFFTSLAIAIIGILILAINMITAITMRRLNKMASIFIIQIIAGLMYGVGGLGVLGFGIAWIVTYLKH